MREHSNTYRSFTTHNAFLSSFFFQHEVACYAPEANDFENTVAKVEITHGE